MTFVSRAGLKLDHALTTFEVDVTGLACADFGCNVGGFTDCLLKKGAASVIAIDTGYGTLAWALRNDPRVTVRERTNALHAEPDALVDLITIDLAWTPQHHALPAAVRWLKPGGRIITLVKPHYELRPEEKAHLLTEGRLAPEHAEAICTRTLGECPAWNLEVLSVTRSPVTGKKSSKRGSGNVEFLALLARLGE